MQRQVVYSNMRFRSNLPFSEFTISKVGSSKASAFVFVCCTDDESSSLRDDLDEALQREGALERERDSLQSRLQRFEKGGDGLESYQDLVSFFFLCLLAYHHIQLCADQS